MRLARDLAEGVWYEVSTAVNVGEPLFRLAWGLVLFYGVLRDAKGRFKFEMRGLVLYEAGLSFYIKPADGYELPKIMQWVKQTFSKKSYQNPLRVCSRSFDSFHTGHVAISTES